MSDQRGFYTNFALRGNTLFLRGIDGEGNSFKKKVYPTYDLFFLTDEKDTSYRTLFKKPLKKVTYNSVKDAKKAIESYSNMANFPLFYNHRFEYGIINEMYPGELTYDVEKIVVGFLDIETESEVSFAKPENPTERINAITYAVNGHYHVFGMEDFDVSQLTNKNGETVTYYKCENEVALLLKFIDVWKSNYPHIITGWFSNGFDLPYIVRRADVIGLSYQIMELSPWGSIETYLDNGKYGDKVYRVDIFGVSQLDYLDLYLKFELTKRESYKLSHIGEVEKLEEKKISYEEEGSLRNLYKTNYQKFITYNIGDIKTLVALDKKKRMIELALYLSYASKTEYVDCLSQMRMWECRIMNHLRDMNIIPHQTGEKKSREEVAGGYVKDAATGTVDWTVSLDLNSLYPCLMMTLNISPETVDPKSVNGRLDIDSIVATKLMDKTEGYITAANGVKFLRDEKGFLPKMVEKLYTDRKKFKGKQESAKERLQLVKLEMKRRGLS